MLKVWRLAGFKSVLKETELKLAPLTIFAGANSSGKSTVIQSMLLTAQTLQSPVVSRPVILNGHITRLGAFPDIVSNANEKQRILIGFELDESWLEDQEPVYHYRRAYRSAPYYYRRSEQLETVACHFMFSMRGASREKEILRLQPRLEETRLYVTLKATEKPLSHELLLRRSRNSRAERLQDLQLDEQHLSRPESASLDFEVIRSPKAPERSSVVSAQAKNAGATFSHFLPTQTSVVFDVVEAEVNRLVEFLTVPPRYYRDIEIIEREFPIRLINQEVARIVQEIFRTTLSESSGSVRPTRRAQELLTRLEREGSLPAKELLQLYNALPSSMLALVTRGISERTNEIRTAARAGRTSEYQLRYIPLPGHLAAAADSIQQFFASSVKYLGPLRDEPKPVYPLAGSTDPRDVGFRGEHTAAVLDIHRNTLISYIPSSCYIGESIAPTEAPVTLLDAVLDWLGYMGVGSDVRTIDRGKLGHELKIATRVGGSHHDLTQVGVGVSQVLPILVLSLLAEPGATLIFEQPELHLHPRVQTRLADFFVSMTQIRKQCIVETHSEYLITRLRYLAAISSGTEVADSAIMYFVEKEADSSVYRMVRISEFGTIQDWPRGFFDESEANSAALLRAGMTKRRRQHREVK